MNGWVAVIGPGAIGATLAASLRRAGRDVLLVARDAAGARVLNRRGLSVAGFRGAKRPLRVSVRATHRPRREPGCAAVFLCVKAPDVARALPAVRALAGRETPVVSLLNGVAHVRPVLAAAGSSRAVFGVCYIAAMRLGPGAARHTGGGGVSLAVEPGNRKAAAAAARILREAGWPVSLERGRDRLLWTKLVLNAAVNPLGALSGKPNGDLANNPALRALLRKATQEAAGIARAAGIRPLYADMPRRAELGCLSAPLQMNSMSQDLASGRPTEADAILKPILDAARGPRGRAPLLEGFYRLVKRLEHDLG